MSQLSKINIRSFLIVLFAFVGNAQVFGVDIALFIILPPLLFLSIPALNSMILWKAYIFLIMFYCLLAVQVLAFSKGIFYFPPYVLWPLKVVILITLLAFTKHCGWPVGNTLLFLIMSVFLIMIGDVEDGRLVSLFGPNMLYRIFGMLLFFTLLKTHFSTTNIQSSVLKILSIVTAMYGLLLTGSSGAIIVLVMIITIFASTKLQRWYYPFLILPVILFLFYLFWPSLSLPGEFVTVLRFVHKLGNLEASSRLVGWTEIMSQRFSILGAQHSDFSSIWSYGFMYPHNLLVELYGFYGLHGMILIGFLLINLFYLYKLCVEANVFAMVALVIITGSMFSGDLSDNYGALGLGIGLFFHERSSIRIEKFGGTLQE